VREVAALASAPPLIDIFYGRPSVDLESGGEAGDQMADDRLQRAIALFNAGLRAQQEGEIERAIELYRGSIEIYPTAEGHTFLGWALSYQGKLDEAIEHCHRAIEIDPDFGNPYNDIGVYLMQRQQFDEAIVWLERAKQAQRYEPRHFPYINLGNIYTQRGQLLKAIEEFTQALKLAPWDERIRNQIAALSTKLN
jgi:tetratricopeptide (TPR) repeat protein